MPSIFSRLKGRDGKSKSKKNANLGLADQAPKKPRWEDAWTRTTVEPDEVQDLIRRCTEELKARGMCMTCIQFTTNPPRAIPLRGPGPCSRPKPTPSHTFPLILRIPSHFLFLDPACATKQLLTPVDGVKPSTTLSYYFLSDPLPTPAPSVPLCATSSMAIRCSAGRLSPRSYA